MLHLFLSSNDQAVHFALSLHSSHATKYQQLLNDECKIHFKLYTENDSSKTKWRDLIGPEQTRLFEKLMYQHFFHLSTTDKSCGMTLLF